MIKKIVVRIIGAYLNITAYLVPKYSAKKSYKIFSSPIRLTLKPEQISFLNTAENEDLAIAGSPTIRVYKWGSGPKKVLFSHGWQSHSFRWVKYINKLMQNGGFTIYAFDAPAQGQSAGKLLNAPIYSRCIEGFIEKYGKMDYHVGHSFGGFTLLYTFHRWSKMDAKGIVILASPGNAMDFVYQYKSMLGLNNRAFNLLVANFQERFSHKPEYFKTEVFAQSIQIPGLIIHDTQDQESPFHYAEKLHQVWTNSSLTITEGLGHKLRSKEVVDKVVDFML